MRRGGDCGEVMSMTDQPPTDLPPPPLAYASYERAKPKRTRLATIALRVSLFAAAVEIIAILVLLANVIFNGSAGPPDKWMAIGMGFSAAMLPSMFVGLLAAAFARGWRLWMFGLQFILAAAGLAALMLAGSM